MIEASGAIMDVYSSEIEAIIKEDGSPVTKADLESSKIINSFLNLTGIPVIGEETEVVEFNERQKWKENWLVDPLDGTQMFLRKNDEFSVNVAHIVKGRTVFGIIASPVEEKFLLGGEGIGAFTFHFSAWDKPEKWKAVVPKSRLNNPFTVICSRSHTHGSGFTYLQLLENKFGELNYSRKGSALKFFDLAKGRADIYARFAPTMEWDIAAGQAIIEAIGGAVVDVKTNQPLQYNKESLYNPHFIAKSKAFLKY